LSSIEKLVEDFLSKNGWKVVRSDIKNQYSFVSPTSGKAILSIDRKNESIDIYPCSGGFLVTHRKKFLTAKDAIVSVLFEVKA